MSAPAPREAPSPSAASSSRCSSPSSSTAASRSGAASARWATSSRASTGGPSAPRARWRSATTWCACSSGSSTWRASSIRGVGRVDSLLTFLSGFVLTVTPGKVGEVFKSLVLFETHGVPVARTAPIVVAERVTDVIGVVVLIVLGSLGFSGGLLWAGLGAAAVLVLLVVVSQPGAVARASSASSSACRGPSAASARSSTRRTTASPRW